MSLDSFKLETQVINYNRIFLLSDTHLGVRANSLEWQNNIKLFFKEFYIPYLQRTMLPGDVLFFLGDFFDSRQLIDINVLNTAIDIVLELSEILPIYFLTGNHDIYKKYDTDINSIIAFKFIPNVIIYEKPIILTNGNSKILVIPWIGNREIEENFVRANKFNYIFTHSNISGFKYDNGREINTGGIDFFKFKGIKRIFSGHIHKRQEKDHIVYIGSPYHTKRSDIGNKKAVYLFDPQKNTLEATENDFSPIFQKIFLENILELSLENTIKILNNNYTDIIVPDKYVHLFNLTKFIDILKGCNYKKIETSSEKKRFDDELSDFDGVDIKDILTLLELSIQDFGYQMELLVKLKLLNRKYYEKASREDIIL